MRFVSWMIAAMLPALPAALAQDSEVTSDDSAFRLSPSERAGAPDPSSEHAAFMDHVTAEDISGASERANQLEEARRVAPMDILWGVGR